MKKIKTIFLIILILIILVVTFFLLFKKDTKIIEKEITYYLSNNTEMVDIFDSENNKIETISRGKEVLLKESELDKEQSLIPIKLNDKNIYVLRENLVKDKIDIVREKDIYVRTHSTLYSDFEKGNINGVAKKGEKLEIIGYENLLEDGTVELYKVKKDDVESYIYKKYVVKTLEEAEKYNDEYYNLHKDVKDIHSGVGGNGSSLDFFPREKPKFENNIMPEKVNAFYVTSASFVLKGIDQYINYAKTTKINAFVVDIKDNGSSGYKSKVFEEMSPTNYKYGNNSMESYKEGIKKLKDAGFYTIGRITVFKDSWFVKDNPDVAILDKRTGKPFDSGRWPSAFNRKVWEFNVSLAKEAVKEFGFNEIQFDYVRFPDRVVGQEKRGNLDFRNVYKEDKVQAIQAFLMYATDELHKLNVYVSADVFGESVNKYITAYGQYWPAISNVVDVISGMPYPDHFSKNSYGIPKPWENPYALMYNWGKIASERQKEVPTPAIARTWILAQNTMQGYKYNSDEVFAQIKALKDANLSGGYMTWSSSGSLQGYKNRNNAYIKEY